MITIYKTMSAATKDALSQADIIFNRTNVALARSQRLIQSWLPPKPEAEQDSPANQDDDDDFLVPREKTKDETEQEEEEYRAFLEREVGQDLAEIIKVEDGAGAVDGVEGEGDEEEEEKPKKKKKKSKKEIGTKAKSGKSKQDEDQDFLLKCVCALSSLIDVVA